MAKTPLSSLLNQTEAISNVTDTLNEANGVVGNEKLAKALSNTDKVINTVKGVGQLANDVSAMAVGADSVMAGLNTASQLGVGGEKVAKRLGQAQEVIRLAQKAGKMANQLPALAQSPVKAMSAMLSGQAATFPAGLQFTFQAFNLPPETFSVVEFKGEEGYSELFQFTLTLISDKPNIAFNQVLDSLGTLSIYRDGILLRSFTGMVAEFEKGETGFHKTYYTVQLRPEFWRTTLRTNSRIFQQKDLKKIVGTILTEHGISQYAYNFKDAHPIREFCVQYQETDFDFLCRLLAEEGIFFYFEFQPKQHTLIFCDNADSLVTGETISYNPNPEATRRESMIWRFKRAERVRVSSTQLRDYTFKKPGWNAQFGKQASDLDNQRQAYEYFEYPARFKQADRGKAFSQYRLDSLRNEAHQSAGESNATELVLGTRFVLKNHPDKSLNRPWQPIRLSHFGRQPQGAEAEADLQGSGTYYQNHFQFIPITQTWRPLAIPKPQVFGPQMAMVVGPKGEEIFTDKFGRVKVQFLWDRYGEGNDRSSCWIRVSQPWAGAGFGGITIPRIGQEVIVSFLEGDPDQPIIIGRTYHAENLPPGTLPKAATQTIIKSQTHKGKGSNELRMEDSNGKEELYLHAQKDMNTVVKNDQRTTVQKGNKELFVELGNQLTQIGIGFLTERIGGGRITESNMVSVKTSKAGVGEAALPGTQTYQADDEILLKVGEQTSILMNNEEIQLKFGESIVKLNANGVFVNGSKVGLNSPKAESDTGEGASAAVLSPTEEQVQDGGGGRMAHGGEIGQGGGASGQGSAGSSGGKGDKGGLGASGEMCKPPQMGQAKGNSSSDMCKPPQMGQSGNPSSPLSGGVGDVPPGAKSFMPDKRARSNKQCPRVGHPVNPVLGIKVLGEEVDFAFEGILPLSWTRSYYSDQIGKGWLGQGWSVPGVQRLVKVPAGMRYIDEQGSELALPALEPASDAVFLPEHQLWVQRTGYDDYVLQPLDRRLSFSFTGLRLQDGVHYPLTKVEDRYGNQQRFIYQPQTGLPQYMIDGNGRTFSLLFDTINEGKDTRLISIALLAKQADLSEAQKDLHRQGEVLVGYAYDEAGDLAQVIDRYGNITRTFSYRNHIMVSHRDSAGLEAYYEYDNPSLTGKVLRHHTNLGEQWQFIYHPSYTEVIDTLGRREYYYFNEHQELTGQIFADGSQSQNERDDMGRVVKQTDRNGKTTRYVYTPQGQVSKVIQPDGQETRYEYDNQGRLIRQTNGAGHTTQYEYDDKGSLIAEQQGNQRIRFRYTESGLISSMTDPLGNETRYHYNADNQLAAQTDCSDNRTEWHYTPTGQISRLIDAAGNETRYRYDNQQRLTQIDYPDGSQEQFSYDSANRLAIYTDGNGSQTEYRYALDGLPTQRINALGNVFHYQYDPARRLSALVNENQASYRFEYDEGPFNRRKRF